MLNVCALVFFSLLAKVVQALAVAEPREDAIIDLEILRRAETANRNHNVGIEEQTVDLKRLVIHANRQTSELVFAIGVMNCQRDVRIF